MNDETVRDRLIAGVGVPDAPIITAVIDTRSGSPSRIFSTTRCVRGCSQN